MFPDHLVLFDGVCNLCNTSVQKVIRNDRKKLFHFASLQSSAGKKILADYNVISDSILYLRKGKIFQKSGAALRIALRLRFPYPLLGIFLVIPWFLRDPVYDLIARKRYKWFGRKDQCMIPEPELKDRFLN
jgi:predicted DCC family thiol-disulfide oxidoreductase YuxK